MTETKLSRWERYLKGELFQSHDISCVCNDCILDANMMCTCDVDDKWNEERFVSQFCKECGGCSQQR